VSCTFNVDFLWGLEPQFVDRLPVCSWIDEVNIVTWVIGSLVTWLCCLQCVLISNNFELLSVLQLASKGKRHTSRLGILITFLELKRISQVLNCLFGLLYYRSIAYSRFYCFLICFLVKAGRQWLERWTCSRWSNCPPLCLLARKVETCTCRTNRFTFLWFDEHSREIKGWSRCSRHTPSSTGE
jgi:hypothetical protein